MSEPMQFKLNREGDMPHPDWIKVPASPIPVDWHGIGETIWTISMFLLSVSMFFFSLSLLALVGGGLAGWIN